MISLQQEERLSNSTEEGIYYSCVSEKLNIPSELFTASSSRKASCSQNSNQHLHYKDRKGNIHIKALFQCLRIFSQVTFIYITISHSLSHSLTHIC